MLVYDYAAVAKRLTDLKPILAQICAVSGTAGASIGVVYRGAIIHKDNIGYRNVHKQESASSQTLYCIGSMTKAFVVACIGRLVHEEKLKWTTPIREIIPEFNNANSCISEQTTITDILAHRTGLSNDISMPFPGDGEVILSKAELVPFIADLGTVLPFRNECLYNNMIFSLAQVIIERITGLTLDQYLRETVYEPLKMTCSTTQPTFKPDESLDAVAEPYSTLTDRTPYRLSKRMWLKDTIWEGTGGIYTNVDDMLKWAKGMLDAINFEEQNVIDWEPKLKEIPTIVSGQIPLSTPSLREQTYAMGWVRIQLPGAIGLLGDNAEILGGPNEMPVINTNAPSQLCIYHQGETVGYYSGIFLFPETKSAIVILTNSIALNDTTDILGQSLMQALFDPSDPVDMVQYSRKTSDRLLQRYKNLKIELANEKQAGAPRRPTDSYVGKYWKAANTYMLGIEKHPNDKKQLRILFQGLASHSFDLRPLKDDTFEWSLNLDEEARRGRFHYFLAEYYKIVFFEDHGKINGLRWTDGLTFNYTFSRS